MIFIEGPDNEIYSVVLKCSPQTWRAWNQSSTESSQAWTLPAAESDSSDAESPTKPKTTPSKPH